MGTFQSEANLVPPMQFLDIGRMAALLLAQIWDLLFSLNFLISERTGLLRAGRSTPEGVGMGKGVVNQTQRPSS